VYAIEAHPRVFRYLADNVALNAFPHVVLENCAVGAEAGSVAFADSVSDDLNYVVIGDDGGPQMRVSRRTLDEIVPHDLPIALLKIDVEGYERFVLAGATSTLQRTAVVFIEVYEALTRRFGYEAKELGQILRRAGFNLFRHDPDDQA
jgi:FkbM family methyltransferase